MALAIQRTPIAPALAAAGGGGPPRDIHAELLAAIAALRESRSELEALVRAERARG